LVLLPQYFATHGYRTYGTGKLLHHRSDDVFDEYFATEQRWSPLRTAGEANYSPGELAGKAKDTHVLFNNCYANYGATNALELAQLLLDLEAADAS
jgi:hypothetical protein